MINDFFKEICLEESDERQNGICSIKRIVEGVEHTDEVREHLAHLLWLSSEEPGHTGRARTLSLC